MTSILRRYKVSSCLLSESEKILLREMGKLTESMQGLKDAIKRQEKQLSSFIKIGGLQEIQLEPNNREFSEVKDMHELAREPFPFKLEPLLHSVGSETSQMSHWSCSLDTINSSIDDLKHVLKNQDTQVISLIRENEELKNEMKKKEKELKKQKFLLKAERENFEQYKKDTFNILKKKDNTEGAEQDVEPDKISKELIKLKSELAHYRQMYVEQRHTMNRLSKIISSLRDDKLKLRDKLLQQEKQYNKFILEMAQRFSISRREFNLVISKKFQTSPIAPTNLAVCKIADRNARLAYDNCMLKLELNKLREKFFQKGSEENKIKCLTTRSDFMIGKRELKDYEQDNHVKKICPLKTSLSERSGLSGNTNLNLKCAVKTSVTSLIERNSENVSSWQQVLDKKDCVETNVLYHNVSGSESFEVMRTESAPQLGMNKSQL